MKTVAQVAKLTGCSVRTLHHYDAIGLLKPAQITEAGYRLYDQESLKRLNAILLLRELEFPLKEIRDILNAPDFDLTQALDQQIRLLELKRKKLDKLIAHARNIQKTGGMNMDFSAYDNKELERYADEAKKRWGKTDAYKEYAERAKGRSMEQQAADGNDLMDIFRELGQIRHLTPESQEAQVLVAKLQRFITDHYYTCTPQVLRGLGQMYVAGDEMTENIDRAGGSGTARFAHEAIEFYCK